MDLQEDFFSTLWWFLPVFKKRQKTCVCQRKLILYARRSCACIQFPGYKVFPATSNSYKMLLECVKEKDKETWTNRKHQQAYLQLKRLTFSKLVGILTFKDEAKTDREDPQWTFFSDKRFSQTRQKKSLQMGTALSWLTVVAIYKWKILSCGYPRLAFSFYLAPLSNGDCE